MICFVTDKKPISYNSSKKNKFQKELQTAFDPYKKLYPQLPLKGELSSNIVYIHKDVKGLLDVDNLSKPFIDAFTHIIYGDDNQIKHRECSCISLRDSHNIEINYTRMNEKALEKLEKLLNSGANHILYFEVDDFSFKQVKIGGDTQ